jgi:hypothetical protein
MAAAVIAAISSRMPCNAAISSMHSIERCGLDAVLNLFA